MCPSTPWRSHQSEPSSRLCSAMGTMMLLPFCEQCRIWRATGKLFACCSITHETKAETHQLSKLSSYFWLSPTTNCSQATLDISFMNSFTKSSVRAIILYTLIVNRWTLNIARIFDAIYHKNQEGQTDRSIHLLTTLAIKVEPAPYLCSM